MKFKQHIYNQPMGQRRNHWGSQNIFQSDCEWQHSISVLWDTAKEMFRWIFRAL